MASGRTPNSTSKSLTSCTSGLTPACHGRFPPLTRIQSTLPARKRRAASRTRSAASDRSGVIRGGSGWPIEPPSTIATAPEDHKRHRQGGASDAPTPHQREQAEHNRQAKRVNEDGEKLGEKKSHDVVLPAELARSSTAERIDVARWKARGQ